MTEFNKSKWAKAEFSQEYIEISDIYIQYTLSIQCCDQYREQGDDC